MSNKIQRHWVLIFSVVAALTLLASARELISLEVDWQFFHETGFEAVFTKTLTAKLLAGLAFGVIAFLLIYSNLLIAGKRRFPPGGLNLLWESMPQLPRIDLGRLMGGISLLVSFAAFILAFQVGARYWEQSLLFLNSSPAGLVDPLFGKDISFYLFKYPFIDAMNSMIRILIVISAVLTTAVYIFRGGAVTMGKLFAVDPFVKRHIAVLVSLFLLSLSFSFVLDRFGLLTSEHGVLYGASYTDVHARLLMLTVMAALALAAAIVVPVFASRGSLVMPLAALGVLMGLSLLGLQVYPSTLQSFKVSPNEIVLERPYIADHIKFTRYGYGLENMELEPFAANKQLTFTDIRKNLPTIQNIRLWDEEPLLKTYSQLQQIRTYYHFSGVDNDRYTVNDNYRQVMLSPRELSYADLPEKSWINERLVFTHGFGLAMGPVSGITKEGLPEFYIKDIPPVTNAGPKVARPEIYYGESPNDYVIVNTKTKEFSYPTTEGNVYSVYTGKGGVRFSSLLMRCLYAAYFGSFNIVLSSDVTDESRILYNREVIKRVAAIAPFLSYDPDPYMVIGDDGKLFWIIDAYTQSGNLPYSKPLPGGTNYIRNAVKVVVDAYDGSVSLYVVDRKDILAKTYAAIFPTLFKPIGDMRADLRGHVRYPRALLKIQARMFTTFHMTDPSVFYNKEDLWEIPSYRQKTMDPYYLITKLPGFDEEEYILLLPFTPSKRDNLAAWMAARSDGGNYGKVTVYTFPRDRLVFGPRQIDARIDQDAYISQQLTLWGQHGSDVIRGSLLIIPIEDSLIYVQPLFLVATDKGGLPELRRVIVAYGNNVVMEETLDAAIQRLFTGSLPSMRMMENGAAEGKRPSRELSSQALEQLRKAREAVRKEDWAGYGKYLKDLEETLREMAK
ncbi:MAG TPA: UPF0182 family protein [Nitrospirota bacterium]|nr:UPF0182 family protein [Nitrospirota bacterium]